jgi:proline- and glutamine-rich splicing factor
MEELHSQEMEKRKEMQLRQEEDVRHREMEEQMRHQ